MGGQWTRHRGVTHWVAVATALGLQLGSILGRSQPHRDIRTSCTSDMSLKDSITSTFITT